MNEELALLFSQFWLLGLSSAAVGTGNAHDV